MEGGWAGDGSLGPYAQASIGRRAFLLRLGRYLPTGVTLWANRQWALVRRVKVVARVVSSRELRPAALTRLGQRNPQASGEALLGIPADDRALSL